MKGKPAKPSLKNLSKTFPELEKIERYTHADGNTMIATTAGPWISAANLTWAMQAIKERLEKSPAPADAMLQNAKDEAYREGMQSIHDAMAPHIIDIRIQLDKPNLKLADVAWAIKEQRDELTNKSAALPFQPFVVPDNGNRIIQYAPSVFVWCDKNGETRGAAPSLTSARIELSKWDNRNPNQTRLIAEPGYERLAMVLKAAHDQAAYGKGKERHANDQPFHQQRMQGLSELVDSPHGMSYQACKKIVEGLQMPELERQVKELLGAIVYTAGIIVFLQRKTSDPHGLLFPMQSVTPADDCAHSEANYQGCPECGKTMHEILLGEGWRPDGAGYRLIRKGRMDMVGTDLKHAAALRVDIARREELPIKRHCSHCGDFGGHFKNCVTQVNL